MMWLSRSRALPLSAARALSFLGLGLALTSLTPVLAQVIPSMYPGTGALDEFDTIQSLPTTEAGK